MEKNDEKNHGHGCQRHIKTGGWTLQLLSTKVCGFDIFPALSGILCEGLGLGIISVTLAFICTCTSLLHEHPPVIHLVI